MQVTATQAEPEDGFIKPLMADKTGTYWLLWAISMICPSFPPGTDPNNPVGYACGDSGRVWEITSTLTNLNSGSASNFRGISAPSVNNVWVCGGNRIYYYNGTDFTSQGGPTGTFNDIHFINNQEGWAVGFNGIILHTIDAGTTWTEEGAGLTTAFLRGVQFTSTTNGYVVGNGKTLIKYGMPLATEDANGLPTEFSLSQNYPNPFNPATKINFNLTETGFTTLKVFDILGNEVAILVNKEQPPGEYSVKFNIEWTDLESVPMSGIYFYQLTVGNNVETKKMVLMK